VEVQPPARPSDGASQPAPRQGKRGAAARGCVLRHQLHARGDTYEREEGHLTPAMLTIVLLARSSRLRDQATGRVSQRRDKANGVRQCGDACSGTNCMLGVTRTRARRAISRQPRLRFCCWRGPAPCETKRWGESASAATKQLQRGAAVRGRVLWRPLHARGDTYQSEEGHVTPATLSILLSLRCRYLRVQATGQPARRQGKRGAV
jgi:hypothetical protein